MKSGVRNMKQENPVTLEQVDHDLAKVLEQLNATIEQITANLKTALNTARELHLIK